MKHKIEFELEQLHEDLHELTHYFKNLKKNEEDLNIKKINHKIIKILNNFSKLSNDIKNKEWENRKLKRYEYYNSLLLIAPTILGALILIYSVISTINWF